MMSYTGRFNRIIKVLNDRGLDKTAADVSEAKDAMYGLPSYDPPYRRPLRQSERAPNRSYRSDPNTPFAREGEFIIELNPTTGKEELKMWDGKRLIPRKELEEMVVKGVMREERLSPALHNSSPEAQRAAKHLMELANKKRTFSNMSEGEIGVPYFPRERLAYISDCLEKRGYTLLVKKLKTAMEEYKEAESEEVHKIPSIEKVYEESGSPEKFDKNIKKLKSIHDKINEVVEDFEDNYKSEVLDKYLSDDITEDEAVKTTIGLVSEADKATDSQIDKISK